MRLLRRDHLPGLAGLLAPLLVLLCVWALPAWAFSAEAREESFGEPVEMRWGMKTPRHQTFSWRETVTLPADGPGLVKPSLPYVLDLSDVERGALELVVRTFVNGVELGRFTQWMEAGKLSSIGYPDYLYGLPREAFRPGANEVLVVADVTVPKSGEGVAVLRLGPPLLRFVPDTDGDGVSDAHQVWSRAPSHVLALGFAIPAAPLAFLVTRRALGARGAA